MLTVISSERKDNKKGKWLVLVCKNEKDQDRTYNVFDNDDAGKKIINESFKGPGKYEEKLVKNGQYWNLTELTLLSGGSPGAGPASSAGVAHPPASHAGVAPAPAAGPKVTRAEIAQVCVAAAARVYDGKGNSDTNLNDAVALLVRVLLKECADFINAGTTSTKAPEGA